MIKTIKVKVSHYEPWLGGTNCFDYQNGECVSKMSNGERWQDWVDKAIACPQDMTYGTKIWIGKQMWICKDHGGAIVRLDNDTIWVDQLTKNPQYQFGEIVDGYIVE